MPLLSAIMSSGSVTATVDRTMLVAGVAINTDADFITPTNSFTERGETSSGTPDIICADRTVATIGTYGTDVSQTPSPVAWSSAGIVIALRDAAETHPRCSWLCEAASMHRRMPFF